MGDRQDDQAEERDEPQVRQRSRQQAEPQDISGAVRSTLSEMVRSGELVLGGGGDDDDDRSGHKGADAPSSPNFDLRGAIRDVLDEERQQGEAERERRSVHERLERLEKPPKQRQWGKPWTPFGG